MLLAAAATPIAMLPAAGAQGSTGDLAYQGCISGNTATGPAGSSACALIPSATAGGDNSGLDGVSGLAVSPDATSLYAGTDLDDSVARFARDPSAGALTYQSCITGRAETGPTGSAACSTNGFAISGGFNSGLNGAVTPAVSPDATSVYVAAQYDSAISRFDRDAGTGGLTWKDCITGRIRAGPGAGNSGACATIPSATTFGDGSGLYAAFAAPAISPDGKSVYLALGGDDAVARFDRDPMTGVLTYQGCITGDSTLGPGGSSACAQIGSATSGGTSSGLDYPNAVALSPDGGDLYVTSGFDSAVARFDRDATTGALTYQGCITAETQSGPAGSSACALVPTATSGAYGSGLYNPNSVAVSRDGRSLYAAGGQDSSVARFDRDVATGAISFQDCTSGDTATGPSGTDACDLTPGATSGGIGSGLWLPLGNALSPDDATLYLSSGDDAIVRFDRDTATGALSYVGCTSGDTATGSTGTDACQQIPSATSGGVASGLDIPGYPTVSRDGKSVYVSAGSDDSIVRFDREDLTAPETTITEGPPSTTGKRKAKFEFESSEPLSTFKCKLDSKRAKPCNSPKTYGDLPPGDHTFRARGTDPSGNRDPTPDKHSWRIRK